MCIRDRVKRVDEILRTREIKINDESKIIWKNHPIARLKKGNDYLNPDIDIIADESLNEDSKLKLIKFLNFWLSEYINEILGDLIKLTKNIEDKLSDKLHDELTKSFIDKKISILSRSLKQDLVLNTEINDDNKIHIDGQLIGELKGLKFLIEVTSKTLDTDIKSIKKAARKGVEKELVQRVDKILEDKDLKVSDGNKIIWKDNPIARLKRGNDYLSPEIEIIADDSLNEESKMKLINFLKKWLDEYISELLGDLIKLTKHKINNQYLRGLVFQLYENNGVIKRNIVDKIVKLIPTEERKKLWSMGIKIGRYHIYLPKMLKPKAVELSLIHI